MGNCTIYSHHIDFEKVVQLVKTNMPKATVEYHDGGLQKSVVAHIKGGFFSKSQSLTINYRQRENPSYKLENIECGLTQNLAGMLNFVQSIEAQNENVQAKFLHKIASINAEMPFIAEPAINADMEALLRKIMHELDAFIFTQAHPFFNKWEGPHFVDKQFNLILDTAGNSMIQDLVVNVDSKYHDQPSESVTAEQSARKAKSETLLASLGIPINKYLPCVADSNDIQLRNTKAVIDRAYALLVIAVKGEGIEQEHLHSLVSSKNIDSLTPEETRIYQANTLTDQERAYATWRYESLNTMLWALGKVDELVFPSEICNVELLVNSIFQPSRVEFEKSVNLRSTSEILDELDKIYRINWACVDARIKGQQAAADLDSSIVYERHYSLNWLTNYQNQEWDDVQANT